MLRIEFHVEPLVEGEELEGFDLGDMTVIGETRRVNSADFCPAMMVFVSIPHLLDGLIKFFEGRREEFRFEGIESNFFILFKKAEDGRVRVITRNCLVATLSPRVLAADVFRSVSEFLQGHPLPPGDAAGDDAKDALQRFEAFLKDYVGR